MKWFGGLEECTSSQSERAETSRQFVQKIQGTHHHKVCASASAATSIIWPSHGPVPTTAASPSPGTPATSQRVPWTAAHAALLPVRRSASVVPPRLHAAALLVPVQPAVRPSGPVWSSTAIQSSGLRAPDAGPSSACSLPRRARWPRSQIAAALLRPSASAAAAAVAVCTLCFASPSQASAASSSLGAASKLSPDAA